MCMVKPVGRTLDLDVQLRNERSTTPTNTLLRLLTREVWYVSVGMLAQPRAIRLAIVRYRFQC